MRKRIPLLFLALGTLLAPATTGLAESSSPPALAAPSQQNPPAAKSAPISKPVIFEVGGHKAYVYTAPQPAPGKPWIWNAPTIKGDVILARHKMYAEAFHKAGIAIAGFDQGEVRGSPASTERFNQFYEEMVKQGYSPKPILLGQSRGGLMTLSWAFRHPDKIRAWVGIYPVCNLTSWPLKSSKKETLADYGLTEEELRSRLPEFNPVSNLASLAKLKVPMFAVHGDKDGTVPYNDNTKVLKENYEAAGGSFSVKIIPGAGHEVIPAFFECPELIEFVLKNSGN